MTEKEITETYYFMPTDFNDKGRRFSDGVSFRDVVKDYERDFHETPFNGIRNESLCQFSDHESAGKIK